RPAGEILPAAQTSPVNPCKGAPRDAQLFEKASNGSSGLIAGAMRRKGFKVFLTNGWGRGVARAGLVISRQPGRAPAEAEAMQRQCSLGFEVGSHRLCSLIREDHTTKRAVRAMNS